MHVNEGRGEEVGGEEGWVGGGRLWQLQCLLLYPRERLRYICLLKASPPDKHGAAAERYKASSVVPKSPPPHPSPPPESIGTVCMFCMLRQKRFSFNCALPLWRGLNGAAHRCGNCKNQRRRKRHRVLLQLQNPPQTRAVRPEHGFCTQYAGLSSSFACLGRGKPLEGSRRTGTEEQTKLLRKESGLQRLHSYKERISRWDADPVASPPSSWALSKKSVLRSDQALWSCLRLLAL